MKNEITSGAKWTGAARNLAFKSSIVAFVVMMLVGASAAFAAHTSSATIAPEWARANEARTYTVTVTNNGADNVDWVTITKPADYGSITTCTPPTGWAVGGSGTYYCEFYTTTAVITAGTSKNFIISLQTPVNSNTYNWIARTRDNNMQYYTTYPITGIDSIAPTTSEITSPLQNAYIKGTITITANAIDALSGVKKVEFYKDGALLGTDSDSTGGWTYTWTTTSADDGAHSLTATVYDKAENSRISIPISVTVDNTEPTTEITSPVNDAYVKDVVDIIGTASDTNIKRYVVDFGVGTDPSAWGLIAFGSNSISQGILATWNTIGINGLHTLRVNTTDKAGTESILRITINIDNTPPATSLSSNPITPDGSNGWFITVPSITLSCSDYDPTYCDSTNYNWDNGANSIYSGPITAPSGEHTLYYNSIDKANTQEPIYNQIFKVDTNAPSYTWNYPLADSYYNDGATIPIDALITEINSGIVDASDCNIKLDNAITSFTGVITYSATTNRCMGMITLNKPSGLSDGPHSLTIQVSDNAGNSQISESRQIQIDNTPPADPTGANVKAGTNNAANVINSFNKNSVSVDVTFASAPEAGTVTVKLTHGATTVYGTAPANTAGTVTTITGIDASALPDEIIDVSAKVIDSAGNEDLGGFISGNSAAKDVIAPIVSAVLLSDPSPTKAGTVEFTINFNENMDTSVNPTVTFGLNLPYNAHTVVGTWGADLNSWPGTYAVDGTTGDGTNTISVSGAKDAAGNVMTVDTANTFVIDTVAPTSSATSPTYDNAGTIPVSFTASDATSGVATTSLYYRVDTGSGFDAWTSSGLTLPGISGTFNFDPVGVDGTYEFYTRALDNAGIMENAPASADDSTIFDDTMPSITNLAVSKDPAKAGDVLMITFDVNEALSSNPTVTVAGNAATYVSHVGTTYTYTYTVLGTETQGDVTVAVSATDLAENTGTASRNDLTLDFTAPSITVYTIDPANIMPSMPATIDVAFFERVKARIDILDSSGHLVNDLYYNPSVINPDPMPWSGTYTNGTSVPNGVYTVKINLTDEAGNNYVNTSKTITVYDFILELSQGWNQISVPNAIDAASKSRIMDNYPVFGYVSVEHSMLGRWICNSYGGAPCSDTSLTAIEPAIGYFVFKDDAGTDYVGINYVGGGSSPSPPSTNSMNLKYGWNLVGYGCENSESLSISVPPETSDAISQRVLWWNMDSYETIYDWELLTPGKGYWALISRMDAGTDIGWTNFCG